MTLSPAHLAAILAGLSLVFASCGLTEKSHTERGAVIGNEVETASPSEDSSLGSKGPPPGPQVPLDGDVLVRISDIEYLGSVPAAAGTDMKLNVTVTDIVAAGSVAPPKFGKLQVVHYVGIDLSQSSEATLWKEQRTFDVGRYEEAYMSLEVIEPYEHEHLVHGSWKLRSSFEIRDRSLHFLGAGYNMDASFRAARTAAADVVPLSASDLEFVLAYCNELFGGSAHRSIDEAISSALKAMAPPPPDPRETRPGVPGLG